MAGAAGLGEEGGDFGGGWLEVVGCRSSSEIGREVAQHGGELQLGEECAARGVVGRLRAHRIQRKLDRHVRLNGDEFLGKQDVVAVVL